MEKDSFEKQIIIYVTIVHKTFKKNTLLYSKYKKETACTLTKQTNNKQNNDKYYIKYKMKDLSGILT